MKKIFFILFTLVAFISYGQNNQHKILYDNNGKVLLNSAGTQVLSTEEGAVDGYNYTPNPEWIPVHGVADNEIWILAFNNGDRYSSFTCTVGSSADYAMDIIGGADGKTLLQTIDTASGKPINFQIPATGGKWCSSGGYYTFKLRIYAVNPTNNILTFALSQHPSTTTTYNRWKIINFGTKSLTSLNCYLSTSLCNDLLYANTYYCENITTTYCFPYCIALTTVTMPKTMNQVTYLGDTKGYGSFHNCTALTTVTMPQELTSLKYFGAFGDNSIKACYGTFSNCTSLQTIVLPKKLNSLLYFGGTFSTMVNQNYAWGTFKNCISLKNITLPDEMNSLKGFGGASLSIYHRTYGTFFGCSSLEYIKLPNILNNVISFGGLADMYASITDGIFNGCVNLQTVEMPSSMIAATLFFGSFINCSKLVSILGNCNIQNLTNFKSTFNGCNNLDSSSLILPSNSVSFSSVILGLDSLNLPTLRTNSFLLTGTSNAVRSTLSYINIDWANSNFGGTGNIDIRYNSLSATELDRIFTALPTVTGTHTINVASNVGAATCTPSIATAKGWTVVTS